jgi:FkbM family methyltransferase
MGAGYAVQTVCGCRSIIGRSHLERDLMNYLEEYIKLLHRSWKYRYAADRNEISYLLQKIKKGDTVFDIGAHKGGYTYWMKKAVGKKGKVIAFEPQKKGADLLNFLFSRSNVHTEHLALSDKKEILQLFIQPQKFNVSFEASLEDKYENSITETISSTTIDTYCQEHKLSPSFLKIDVEGHEQKLINGAARTLQNLKPKLLIEAEARHIGKEALHHLFNYIESIGYAGYFFWKQKLISIGEFDIAIHQQTKNIGTDAYQNNFVFEAEP